MRQHKKNAGLTKLFVSIPKELHQWLKTSAKAQDKTISLYLSELLEQLRKLREDF